MTTFALDLSKAIEKAVAQQETIARKIAISTFQKVIEMSPVDTGRFRANWNCSIGSADLSTSASTDQSKAVADATRTPLEWKPLEGKSLFLTNSLPYAQRLEEGYSGQAPQGMVRLSIQSAMLGIV